MDKMVEQIRRISRQVDEAKADGIVDRWAEHNKRSGSGQVG